MIARRNIKDSDEGAMLLIALLVITVVAVVSGALLTLSGGKFLATVNLRKVAASAYASDTAAKLAINDLVLGSNAGALANGATYPSTAAPSQYPKGWVFDNNALDGTGCFGLDSTNKPLGQITMPAEYSNAQSGSTTTATVTCTPVPGTGVFGSTGTITSNDNGAGRSITILGSSGLSVNPQAGGNQNKFKVHGDVASRGPITVGHGFLYTNGAVTAAACTPSMIVSSTTPTCNASAGAAVTDPYAATPPPLTSVPTLGSWGACTNGVMTFQQGYYDDANALTAATNSCPKSVFSPGVYYFDFHNNPSDPTYANGYAMAPAVTGCKSTPDQWCINNTVIGGVPTGGSTIPGACYNPIDSTGNGGVQFVFGGDSQMVLGNNAQVELCAPDTRPSAPVAIFGLDGGQGRGQLAAGYPQATASPGTTAGTVTSTTSPAFGFTAPSTSLTSAVSATGGGTASWTSSGNRSSGTLTLGGFSPAPAVPAGSILTSAKLNVWHDETPASNKTITPTLQMQVGSGSATPTSTQPTICLAGASGSNCRTGFAEDSIDVTKDLAPVINAGNLASTKFLFTDTASGNGTAAVDAVTLDLTYYTPALRGETTTAIPGNCVVALSCPAIITGNGSSFGGSFVVHGVAYLPAASVTASLGNQTGVLAFRWGLVAKAATLGSLNQFPFAYPVVSIPDMSLGFVATITIVDLKVFLCSGAGPCSGAPSLTARVAFTDGTSNSLISPVAGQRVVNILSWAEQR